MIARRNKIFTPEVLETIPKMVARGLRSPQIAVIVGCKLESLKVICSRHKISLGPRGRPYRASPRSTSRAIPQVVAQLAAIKINVEANTLTLIAMRAEKENTTVDQIAAKILKIVAHDNLYDAVIDEAAA